MIISFKIENFRSIKDQMVIDFVATKKLNEEHLPYNVADFENQSLLKSIILYGRNASGKSNVLNALKAISFMVEHSDSFKLGDNIPPYEPFLFDKNVKNNAVKFEIVFVTSKTKFKYSISYTSKSIINESLYFYPNGVKAKLFSRKEKKVSYGEYYKGVKKSIEDDLLDNQLFLSKSSSSKISFLNEAYLYFKKYFYVSTVHDTEYDASVIRIFSELAKEDKRFKENILKLLIAADTNITSFSIEENNELNFKFPENIPENIKEDILDKYKYNIRTNHLLFENNELIGEEALRLEQESFGTKKLLAIGSLIIDALEDGSVIVIDELDKGLHPLLTKMLINLFNSKSNNPHNAQLIFATHDSTLLDSEIFRRDQICFVDKEYEGGSIFYKLSDVKGIRKDVPIDKWYLSGRFSAIPVINDVELEF